MIEDRAYTYGECEAMLVRAFCSEHFKQAALRGRLKHLSRLGMPFDKRVGRGKKTTYNRVHILQWALALELEQVGLDPKTIVTFIVRNWCNVSFERGGLLLRPKMLEGVLEIAHLPICRSIAIDLRGIVRRLTGQHEEFAGQDLELVSGPAW